METNAAKINAPPGFVEGTKVEPFITPTGGQTLFRAKSEGTERDSRRRWEG